MNQDECLPAAMSPWSASLPKPYPALAGHAGLWTLARDNAFSKRRATLNANTHTDNGYQLTDWGKNAAPGCIAQSEYFGPMQCRLDCFTVNRSNASRCATCRSPAPPPRSRDGPSGASSGIGWQYGPGCYGRPIHLMYGPPATASPVFQTELRDALGDEDLRPRPSNMRTGDHRLPNPIRPLRCDRGRTRPDIVGAALPV